MIQIITPGDEQRVIKRIMRFECHMCGCVFDTDEYIVLNDYRDGIICKEECPCCHRDVWN